MQLLVLIGTHFGQWMVLHGIRYDLDIKDFYDGNDNKNNQSFLISASRIIHYAVLCLTGSALDIHFNGVNVASISRELEDQEGSDLGLASKRLKL